MCGGHGGAHPTHGPAGEAGGEQRTEGRHIAGVTCPAGEVCLGCLSVYVCLIVYPRVGGAPRTCRAGGGEGLAWRPAEFCVCACKQPYSRPPIIPVLEEFGVFRVECVTIQKTPCSLGNHYQGWHVIQHLLISRKNIYSGHQHQAILSLYFFFI